MTLPSTVRVMTQVIHVTQEPNLVVPTEVQEAHEAEPEGMQPHVHKAYGVYSERDQTITLDDALGFERIRTTFLHENLHALLAVTELDTLLNTAMGMGFDEHMVATFTPVLLAWMRDNPQTMEFLQETQT